MLTYADAGERQTGPNIFWALSALHYAHFTTNTSWLCSKIPTLRRALAFLRLEAGITHADVC